MAFDFKDLDEKTRQYMLEEIERDLQAGTLYLNPRLSAAGQAEYPLLLQEAAQAYDDDWLANELAGGNYFNPTEQRRKRGGGVTYANMPANAAETLAEGEFNRFYIRGLCRRAIDEGIAYLVIYRGRRSGQPRPESEGMIGEPVNAADLLKDLRDSPGVDTAMGLPPGPNSGLTVRLP